MTQESAKGLWRFEQFVQGLHITNRDNIDSTQRLRQAPAAHWQRIGLNILQNGSFKCFKYNLSATRQSSSVEEVVGGSLVPLDGKKTSNLFFSTTRS